MATKPAVPARNPEAERPTTSVPFDYVGQSWVRVPARVGSDAPSKMMFDTGMGITLLTPEACARARCVREGKWSGRRMSGQSVELTIARISSLTVAGHRVDNARVAIFESDVVMHRDLGVDGIAGLDLFRNQPVTIDHRAMRVILETPRSLAEREHNGIRVPIRVRNDGPSTDVFVLFEVAPGKTAEMEVDSGSLHMILDDGYMKALDIDPDASDVERKDGRDETGNPYTRRFAKLPRAVHLAAAPTIGVDAGSTVMFQKIIHDGLIGQDFLRAHVVTFDLERSAIIFDGHEARRTR